MNTKETMDPQAFSDGIAANTTGIGLVWAQTTSGVIGRDGDMPWHLPEDLKHFNKVTSGHPVIMGRKTWLSFPDKYRPLPNRTNIVITRQENWGGTPEVEGAVVVKSLDVAVVESQFAAGCEAIWILGGGEIFSQSVDLADIAVVTTIDEEADGDTHAPQLGTSWEAEDSVPREGW